MDFRVKKLILEEGMKNIAETEGVKLEMSFDSFTKKVTVDFSIPLQCYLGGVHKECSYCDIKHESADIFKTIEDTRREVRDMKHPTAAGFVITRLRESHFGKFPKLPKIKNVIFNYPATIVFWEDGDKTVVKCQGDDVFDPEKGLAMAIIKKMNGGKGNYCEIFKPWIEKYEKARMEAFFKEQDELMKRGAQIFVKESLSSAISCSRSSKEDDVIAESNVDIVDILEGKVDPLMIKTDEEEEECRSEPNPEYKEKKIVAKCCETCMHDDTRRSEERPKPCDSCVSAILDDGSVSDPLQWEPKE